MLYVDFDNGAISLGGPHGDFSALVVNENVAVE